MRRLHAGVLEIGALDALARHSSPIHAIDPRAKLLAAILYLVAIASFGRGEIAHLIPLAAFPIFVCAAGRVPVGIVSKKLLVAAPFALALGAFEPLVDTEIGTTVLGVGISSGWLSFASIALKVALTVSGAVSLVAVTGMNELGTAAERLGAPRILVAQILLLYRYLFVLGGEAARTSRAAELRSAGRRRSLGQFGSMLGHLLLRALDRGERIHLAMRCRGFTGSIPRLRPSRFAFGDAAFLAGWAAFFAGVRFFDLAGGLGRLALGALR